MSVSLKESILQWSWKSFDQLTKHELYELLSFRQSIFIVEQQSWYQDTDGLDEDSQHLLVKDKKELIGYLRLIPPGLKYETSSIGRIAISESFRGNSLGARLVDEGLRKSFEIHFSNASTISAQEYLINFYQKHGFTMQGEIYDEDGIPHVQMIKNA